MTSLPCFRRSLLLAGFGALLLCFPHSPLRGAEVPAAAATVSVCPSCGGDCDTLTFDHPGICPHCGMTLVPKGEKRAKTVAILLFNGVQIIDYAGPWEVFGEAGYTVFTVAETAAPVKTVFGQSVNPTYTFETAPKADILVVPGGDVGDALCGDRTLIQWIQREAAGSGHVLSVCTGAFLMSKAGLLDGLTVTTYHGAIDQLVAATPRAKVVRDQRFVDSGKIVVTAGLSSGIDGALHLVSVIDTLGAAQSVALNAEYNWQPESGYARAALPDRYFTFKHDDLKGRPLFRAGDRSHWKDVWQVEGQGSVAAFTAKSAQLLSAQAGWKKAGEGQWTFVGDDGRVWHASSAVAADPAGDGSVVWTLELNGG